MHTYFQIIIIQTQEREATLTRKWNTCDRQSNYRKKNLTTENQKQVPRKLFLNLLKIAENIQIVPRERPL